MAVKLTKGGLVDENDKETKLVDPTLGNVLRYWRYVIDIDPGYTIGDLVNLLSHVVDEHHVLSALLHCDLAAYLEAARQSVQAKAAIAVADEIIPAEPDSSDDIDYIEVYNHADIDHFVPGKKVGNRRTMGEFTPPYTINRNCHGVGPWAEPYEGYNQEFPNHPATTGYAIEYTPIGELLDYEIRYDPKIEFEKNYLKGDIAFATEINITFGELIEAVFWEIGWFGTPEGTLEATDNLYVLQDDVKKIQDGTLETHSFDELLKETFVLDDELDDDAADKS